MAKRQEECKMGLKSVHELLEQAEELKQDLWTFMDENKREHSGVKETMNELLDLIDELRGE